MKITRISLKGYQQFKDLEIDLTYPKGHEKEGQPLDKVCFIGQSGTGKTTILRLIKFLKTGRPEITRSISLPPLIEGEVGARITGLGSWDFWSVWDRLHDGRIAWREDRKEILTPKKFAEMNEARIKYFAETKPSLILFPSDLPTRPLDDQPMTYREAEGFLPPSKARLPNEPRSKGVLDFGYEDPKYSWGLVLEQIRFYRTDEYSYTQAFLNALANREAREEVSRAMDQWRLETPNPLEHIESVLGGYLRRFGVGIVKGLDPNALRLGGDLGRVDLCSLETGQFIDPGFWSTGTRRLIDTAVPLIQLKPKNATIIIDEPEASFYPDIQMELVNFYASLTTDCQFFYATHSPIIAASFDPWEIVELKFDPSFHYVEQELNYDGERHVDNYKFNPKYLAWDDILLRLFDLKEDGNANFRQGAMNEAAELNVRLKDMKAKGKDIRDPEFKSLAEKYLKLQNLVGWDAKT